MRFETVKDADCRTRNVVYCIRCNRCNIVVYVGETERQLKERMAEHLRDVRLKKDKPINDHFNSIHDEGDLRFSILRNLHNAGHCERLLYESLWIRDLNTSKPCGCNVKDSNNVPPQLLKHVIKRYRQS